MSTLALEQRPQLQPKNAPRLFESAGSTLEDYVLGAWEDLVAEGRAECPVCGGQTSPPGCSDCGSQLS
jgi:hypothetical protein